MIRWLEQFFCSHEFIRATDKAAGRHYTICMKCLKQSPGIYQGPQIYRPIEEN